MAKEKPASAQLVIVREEPIELCALLKFAGLTDSGGAAKQAISEGSVTLNGVVETQKRKKIRTGDKVGFAGQMISIKVG